MAFPEVLGLMDMVRIISALEPTDDHFEGLTGLLIEIKEQDNTWVPIRYTVLLPQHDLEVWCSVVQLLHKANPPTHHGSVN